MVSRPTSPSPPPGGSDHPTGGRELELTYPCAWSYTVISEEEGAIRAAVASIVGELEHTLSHSHTSSGGRYLSFHLEVLVTSDAQRLSVFQELHEHPDVRYVL